MNHVGNVASICFREWNATLLALPMGAEVLELVFDFRNVRTWCFIAGDTSYSVCWKFFVSCGWQWIWPCTADAKQIISSMVVSTTCEGWRPIYEHVYTSRPIYKYVYMVARHDKGYIQHGWHVISGLVLYRFWWLFVLHFLFFNFIFIRLVWLCHSGHYRVYNA
jgi:hypothetical protein